MDVKKCFDTYVLMEVALGNKKFADYVHSDFIITDLTLAEFYAVLLREFGEQTADYWYNKFKHYSTTVIKSTLINAIKFRYKYRKRKISFFDAVGYVFSLENNFPFVTGDKEFENFKGVEFKKK